MTGGTVVLTASAGSFSGLGAALRNVAVVVKERPLLSFSPPLDWSRLDAALLDKDRYRVIALTSPRAARAVVERSRLCGVSWNHRRAPAVWAVGAATMAALGDALGPVKKPGGPEGTGESAAAALAHTLLEANAGGPVLFPCGGRRRDELPSLLRAKGIEVDEVVCYRAVVANRQEARAAVSEGNVLVAASPSVVELLVMAAAPSERPLLVAIGPTTAAAARAAGWPPAAVAREPSTEALAAAITGLLATR
jgi:uroporphyrinogen-III synthase